MTTEATSQSYSFTPLETTRYLNVEITTRCSVGCPMCPRTAFPEFINPRLDMPLEFIEKLNFSPFLERIYLVGANGDPTQHPQFIDFLKKLKKTTSAQININTHGSFKTAKWWAQVTGILSAEDHIIFSIDGLRDTNHIYRINANWRQIEAAVLATTASILTTWKFIVFKHNEHQIFEAMRLAREWGVTYFSVKRSDRWSEPYWPKDGDRNWMAKFKPSEKFVTTGYADMDGAYRLEKKFNSVFNVVLAAADIDSLEREWQNAEG